MGTKQPKKNPIVEDLRINHSKRIFQYRSQREKIRAALKLNPKLPDEQKRANFLKIGSQVEIIEKTFEEISPYFFKLREYVKDPLEQNQLTASYFLFGKVYKSWQATLVLTKDGFHYETMELLRSIQESLDLVFLFIRGEESSVEIKKWFEGSIIQNSTARESIHEALNKDGQSIGASMPIAGMKSGMYTGLSNYTHVSYLALLDLYDVLRDDFDFENNAGFHYTATSSLPMAKSIMDGTIIALKAFYLFINDNGAFSELDNILKKFSHNTFDDEGFQEAVKNAAQRFNVNGTQP